MQDEVVEVLKFMKDHPQMTLATGHGSVAEIDCLIHKATEMGVRIFVNHPHFLIGASLDDIERWAKLGAYIELNAAVFKPISPSGEVPLSVLEKMLSVLPKEQLVVDSDFGQIINGNPVERHYSFLQCLIDDMKVSEAQLNLMTKETPAKLLGI